MIPRVADATARLVRAQAHQRVSGLVVAAAFVGAALTALVTLSPPLHFVHRQHELHVGFATAAALIGLLASYLLFGRFQRRRRLDDLALFIALSLYALANLWFAHACCSRTTTRRRASGSASCSRSRGSRSAPTRAMQRGH